MQYFQSLLKKLSPLRVLILGFLILTLSGALLLMLPTSNANGSSQSFIDALFTATSAVSTTGLIVVDTSSYYSLFGQWIILILVQIGGLGYMVFIVLVFIGKNKNISLQSRKILRESLSRPTKVDMVRFVKIVFIFTFAIELFGALGLYLYWSHYFSFPEAVYVSVFHSISGFCTAGFGLFNDSITKYGHSYYINSIIDLICIAGAAGFFVLYDIYEYLLGIIMNKQPNKLSLHSKIVLLITSSLIVAGSIALWGFEESSFSSSFGNKFLDSTFQIISASTTTGFNTIDIGSMATSCLFLIIILMFIGASPGSTGGGIKTTSFGILIKHIISTLSGKKDTVFFKRKINSDTVTNVFLLTSMSLIWIIVAVLILCATEKESFIRILFETVSAFGTVGLSAGITTGLSTSGKIIITLTMFLGRVGPLALGFSLFMREKQNGFSYPQEEILIG